MFTPTITPDNSFWYQGTADAIYQNLDFLKRSHEPYVVIASGDCVYKLDYNKVLEYHIAKRADVTIVCKDVDANEDVTRFGVLRRETDVVRLSYDLHRNLCDPAPPADRDDRALRTGRKT